MSLWAWPSGESVREVAVGSEPRTLAVSPDGGLLVVTTQRQQALAVVDLRTAKCTAKIPIGGQPVGVVLSTDGRRAFDAQYAGEYVDGQYVPGAVAVVDLAKREVTARIPVRARPFAMARSADGRLVYVTHYFQIGGKGIVTKIDTGTLAVQGEIELAEDGDVGGGRGGVFNALGSIALHPQGHRALVAGMHANVRRGVTQSGRPLSHKTTVQAAVRICDLGRDRELSHAGIVSSFAGQAVAVPAAVTFLGDGEHFVDVYFASHDMKIIRYNERGLVAERSLLELPDGPNGIAVTRDGRTAFVNCRWARSVVQISLADVRDPKILREVRVTDEPWDAQRLLGAKVFHNTRDTRMTPNRWLPCGVCRLDGGGLSDSLVWEFTGAQKPKSPRLANPKSLAVTSWSAPPLLITGGYKTVQEEDQFIRSFLGGSGFIDCGGGAFPEQPEGRSPEMDAVAAFVLSLRPRPNLHLAKGRPRGEIRESADRGKALFNSPRVRCSRCHSGPHLTRSGAAGKNKPADVGTGLRADVPSLRNCWETAPYLHDGRSRTLRDVLTTHNPDNKRGRTRDLSEQDITDLVHFLLAPTPKDK
ncbi:MAG: YVTN family beta-propeller protein [Limisphaerales bacterium]